jgi:chitinase
LAFILYYYLCTFLTLIGLCSSNATNNNQYPLNIFGFGLCPAVCSSIAATIVAPPSLDTCTSSLTNMTSSHGYRTVAYFVNWAVYARKHFPADIPLDKLTHVLYAFANVNGDTGDVTIPDSWSDIEMRYPGEKWDEPGTNVYGCTKQLFLLKKRNRNLKVLLSIGGWTYSPNFARPCSTESGRATFARTAVALLAERGFDGIDIDWEYPKNDTEASHLVALLRAVRAELDRYASTVLGNPHILLTIASPAGPQNYGHMRLGEVAPLLDFVNLMAYDYAGTWDEKAGHQSNLYPDRNMPHCTPFSTEQAIRDYVSSGVPSDKIVLGMPLYGRAFCSCDGPGGRYAGGGEGSFEAGIWDYKVGSEI